ncbi:UDP-glycosyltransferase family, conserved site [Sesbania bispinosa]|nr:UDP-glycosyltransferase family, conserved site [Sesbania bispinosa]
MESHSQPQQLHVIFVPYPTPGHMIPMVDTARLFAKHGATVTIILTEANAKTFQQVIDNDFNSGYPIRFHVLKFPAAEAGLPDGFENLSLANTRESLSKFHLGFSTLRHQIEVVFQDLKPDCIVSDMMLPWTVDSAAKLGIPSKHKPYEGLVSDTHKFSIPGLPQNFEMTTQQLEEWRTKDGPMARHMQDVLESDSRSYGTVCNSFHDLESDYEELYKTIKGIKAWSLGPVSAWANKDDDKNATRGHMEVLAEEPEWLNWLNSKQDETVLYMSFGSIVRVTQAQLVEIAHGLENSGHNFIWVIRKMGSGDHEDGENNNILKDFEKRMKESKRGYIIWNWAPQLFILDHPAIGGFVTHCGWTSVLESLKAGLPMVTFPFFAEQFYNEKLLVDVLKIGVPVGAKQNKLWASVSEEDPVVTREEISKAAALLMGGEEGREMRRRARKLGDAAKKTIEEGGHSYNNLIQLLDELKSLKKARQENLRKTN